VTTPRIPKFLVAAVLLAMPALAADDHGAPAAHTQLDLSEHVPGAADLEGKIIAPCCWNQTIDIHGSPASAELRREIRSRLKAGEAPAAIEQSIVDRYGPKILAVPSGSRLGKTGVLLAITMGAAGVGALMMLRRWQRRSETPSDAKKESGTAPVRDGLDDRLDAELSRLE
jgi:cytochrome c-type biogenesis protein CcmH